VKETSRDREWLFREPSGGARRQVFCAEYIPELLTECPMAHVSSAEGLQRIRQVACGMRMCRGSRITARPDEADIVRYS